MKLIIPTLCVVLAISSASYCYLSSEQQKPHQIVKATKQPNASALLQEFKNSKYFWTQAEVGKKLVALHDKSVVPAMLALLKSPISTERTNAGRVLAGLGDDRGLFAIIAEVKDKSSRPTEMTNDMGGSYVAGQIQLDRSYAAGELSKLGDKRAEPVLVALLADGKLEDRAAYALGQLGDKRAIPALRHKRDQIEDAKKNHPNSVGHFVHDYKFPLFSVFSALAQLDDTEGMSELAGYLKDKEWTYRRYAVESLADFGAAKAVPLLTPMLRDPSERVRISAAQSLGKIGSMTALPALRAAETPDDAHISWRTLALSNAASASASAIRHKYGIIGWSSDHGVVTYRYAPGAKPAAPTSGGDK